MERAVAVLRGHFGLLELRPTYGPNSASQIATECVRAGAARVLVAGGDGTINEAANGMIGSGVPLGILPGGTANVLAMELRMGGDPVRAAQSMPGMEAVPITTGVLELPDRPPRHFLLMAGIGLDARVVRAVSPAIKRRLGKLAYWAGGFSQVGRRLPEFDATFDGRTVRASFALASRVKNYGGDLEIARHANLLSSELALVLFEGASSLPYLKYFSGVLLNRLDGMKGVTVVSTHELEIRPLKQSVDIQIDGELLGVAPVRISIAPSSLHLLVPAAYLAQHLPLTNSANSGTR